MRQRIERLRSRGDEEGAALITVLIIGLVMVLLVATALSSVTSGLRSADTDQDATGALDAAYAGVQDYLARLNADPTYWAYGSSNPFTTASGGTVTAPPTANPAFVVGTSSTWATLPGSSGTSAAKFRYEVDNSDYASARQINLRSTGSVGSVTKTIVATIRQRSFIDYLYFTDYETQDPLISGLNGCAVYAWQTTRAPACTILFGSADTISGPVHSNDTITVCGTTFQGAVTSSDPNAASEGPPAGCSAGTYAVGGGVTTSPMLGMPATDSSMRAVAAASGCLYTGPTQITYNSNGTMTVISPWTKATEVNGTTGSSPSMCGSLTALHSYLGATVNLLQNNLLFVQDVPIVTTDPNYSSTSFSGLPFGFSCLDSSGSVMTSGSASSAGWKFGFTSYPMQSEVPASGWQSTSNAAAWNTTSPAYGCRSGDLYVEGTVSGGATTAASSNYVYVTDDLTYRNTASDLLGLVGGNAVLVWNPMSSGRNGYSSLLGDTDREIDAAILSVSHTFQVQNFDRGALRGTLTVRGSIAQKFRGPLGSGPSSQQQTTGYLKNYIYDSRLASVVPPDFLPPATVSFKVGRYAQVPAAYSAAGVVLP